MLKVMASEARYKVNNVVREAGKGLIVGHPRNEMQH